MKRTWRLALYSGALGVGLLFLPQSTSAQERSIPRPAGSPRPRSSAPGTAGTESPSLPNTDQPSPATSTDAPSQSPFASAQPNSPSEAASSSSELAESLGEVGELDPVPTEVEISSVSNGAFDAPYPPTVTGEPIGNGLRAPGSIPRIARVTDTPNRRPASTTQARELPGTQQQSPASPAGSAFPPLPIETAPSLPEGIEGEELIIDPGFGAASQDLSAPELTGEPNAEGFEFEARNFQALEATALATPAVALEARGPQALKQGQTGLYVLSVSNLSDQAAEISVELIVPPGTHITKANVDSTQMASGARFDLGMVPGDSSCEVQLLLVASKPGTIQLKSRVRVSAEASLDVAVIEARLEAAVEAPERIVAGEIVPVTITVTNLSENPVDAVRVFPEAPEGVRVQADYETVGEIGVLAPGDSRQIVMHLIADHTGPVLVRWVTEGNGVSTEKEQTLRVVAPELKASIEGPETGILQGTSEYAIVIHNPSDAPSEEVRVVVDVPTSLKVTTLDRQAQYDPRTGRLTLVLPRIAAHGRDGIRFKAINLFPGTHEIDVAASTRNGLPTNQQWVTEVQGLADLTLDIRDAGKPFAVGESTRVRLRIRNQGSGEATGVVVRVEMPLQLSATSPDAERSDGGVVWFPAFSLAPGQEKVFELEAEGLAAGATRIKAIITLDGLEEDLVGTDQVIIY